MCIRQQDNCQVAVMLLLVRVWNLRPPPIARIKRADFHLHLEDILLYHRLQWLKCIAPDGRLKSDALKTITAPLF